MPHRLSIIGAFQRRTSRSSEPVVSEEPPYVELEPAPPAPAPTVFATLRGYAAQLRDRRHPRILVVDDDTRVRVFIERVLRDAGCVVTTADGGARALDLIRDGADFDLIVSDVRMPAMTGPEFVDRVRLDRPEARVLYLTGYNDDLFKKRLALSETEAFLNKPCSVKGLLEAVWLLLCGHLTPAQARA